ncbi:MAG: hypothetical protein GQ564_14290 [Bacteroidales bacterium]|nr:hypothetical protein [Bacteroidales bacterium]
MRKIIILLFSIYLIVSCTSSRCNIDKESETKKLNEFIDNWHHAAAVADENIFFGSLDENAVYLGTDPKERWLKQEFIDWGMKYFERDTAWAFAPYNRFWEFSEDMNYAWFDELLDTHMGICRGSGVLRRYKDGWKIKHYNLALTLPNEQMNEYRNMISEE